MAHKITILAMQGGPDSLKKDVNIVFTLMPANTRHESPTYKPVAFAAMTFSRQAESTQTFTWEREIAFATYDVEDHNGKKCVLRGDRSPVVPAGQYTYFRTKSPVWGPLSEHLEGFSSTYVGSGGSTRGLSIVNCITLGGTTAHLPIIAWPPASGTWLSASSNLVLQAYVVNRGVLGGTILETRDLDHRLFPEPLDCDTLPQSSVLLLTQVENGKICLKERDRGITRSLEGVETLTKSFDVIKNQLTTLVKSLEDTNQRLLVVEKSVGANQTELHKIQTSLATTQAEMSRLDRNTPEVANIAASLDRTDKRVAPIESSLCSAGVI